MSLNLCSSSGSNIHTLRLNLKGAVSAQKALQESKTEMSELLGGTKESNFLSMEKSFIYLYFREISFFTYLDNRLLAATLSSATKKSLLASWKASAAFR